MPCQGWWRCPDVNALDETRSFSRGALPPPVTSSVQTVKVKVANDAAILQRYTERQLARID